MYSRSRRKQSANGRAGAQERETSEWKRAAQYGRERIESRNATLRYIPPTHTTPYTAVDSISISAATDRCLARERGRHHFASVERRWTSNVVQPSSRILRARSGKRRGQTKPERRSVTVQDDVHRSDVHPHAHGIVENAPRRVKASVCTLGDSLRCAHSSATVHRGPTRSVPSCPTATLPRACARFASLDVRAVSVGPSDHRQRRGEHPDRPSVFVELRADSAVYTIAAGGVGRPATAASVSVNGSRRVASG